MPDTNHAGVRIATVTAVVAGGLTLAILGMLMAAVWRGGPTAVFDPPALVELKRTLRDDPQNAVLKERIRQADVAIRAEFMQRQHRLATGRWVLLGALLTTLAAARTARRWSGQAPEPGHDTESGRAYLRQHWQMQDAVLAAVVIAAGVGFFLAWRAGSGPAAQSGPSAGPGIPAGTVDPAVYARQWPRFRGPDGSGHAVATSIPEVWDGAAGQGVAWSTAIPLPGHGSPIVWEDRVYVTGADKEKRAVYALDRATGRVVWTVAVAADGSDAAAPEVMEDTGYAACTPATDGKRVYALFGRGDLAAIDRDGHLVWSQALGPFVNMYGHASSLLTWKEAVIVLLDQGATEDAKSRVVALEGASGRMVWETARPVPASWATPIVAGTGTAAQLVTVANPWVIGYDPDTGAERWRAEYLAGDVAPSPVWADGVVYAVNQGAALAAVRTDGAGVVTGTHLRWKAEENLPDVCSPLCTGPRVYLLTSSGTLTCLASADGHKVWEHELGGPCQASPSFANGAVWVLLQDGVMVRVDDADTFKERGRSALGEGGCKASPAFADGAVFIRSAARVWCLGR